MDTVGGWWWGGGCSLGRHLIGCREAFLTNGDLKARLAAMVRAGSRQRKMAPNSMSFPMRMSTGRQAR